jgi:hypothetical protein
MEIIPVHRAERMGNKLNRLRLPVLCSTSLLLSRIPTQLPDSCVSCVSCVCCVASTRSNPKDGCSGDSDLLSRQVGKLLMSC